MIYGKGDRLFLSIGCLGVKCICLRIWRQTCRLKCKTTFSLLFLKRFDIDLSDTGINHISLFAIYKINDGAKISTTINIEIELVYILS